jgi:hypothetical protein
MANPKPRHWSNSLIRLGACKEAVAWARQHRSLAAAWEVCKRGDWMLWLAGRCSGEPLSDGRRKLVLATCECARLPLPHVPAGEDRPRLAIEAAEAWARGTGSVEAMRYASSAAAYASAYAASAYAASAYAASAAAANAAAAAANANAAAAAAAACYVTLAKCANIVRKHYPEPPGGD